MRTARALISSGGWFDRLVIIRMFRIPIGLRKVANRVSGRLQFGSGNCVPRSENVASQAGGSVRSSRDGMVAAAVIGRIRLFGHVNERGALLDLGQPHYPSVQAILLPRDGWKLAVTTAIGNKIACKKFKRNCSFGQQFKQFCILFDTAQAFHQDATGPGNRRATSRPTRIPRRDLLTSAKRFELPAFPDEVCGNTAAIMTGSEQPCS